MQEDHANWDYRPSGMPVVESPLTSARILGLAIRAVRGAPALTAGEVRELASAVLAHCSIEGSQNPITWSSNES